MKIMNPDVSTYYPSSSNNDENDYSVLLHEGYALFQASGLDASAYSSTLYECMQPISKIGFFLIDPWHPGEEQLYSSLSSTFQISKIDKRYILGYFSLGKKNIESLLAFWARYKKWNSGEWYIGGCDYQFECSAGTSEINIIDLQTLLRHAWNIGSVLCLEEMQQSLLFCRSNDAVRFRFEELKLQVLSSTMSETGSVLSKLRKSG